VNFRLNLEPEIVIHSWLYWQSLSSVFILHHIMVMMIPGE